MCCSGITQILFGILMSAALGLTLAAMFTNGWRHYEGGDSEILPKHGILSFTCKMPKLPDDKKSLDGLEDLCKKWWDDMEKWEKIVVVGMALAVIFEVVALIWNVIACLGCCCKKHIIHPLVLWAVLVVASLAMSVTVFGINNKDAFEQFQKEITKVHKLEPPKSGNVGYSFYMACGALGGAVISTIFAVFAVCFAKKDI